MKLSNFLLASLLAVTVVSTSCTSPRNQNNTEVSETSKAQDNHPAPKRQSLAELQRGVEQNDPEAIFHLGDAYLYGHFGLNDPAKAFPLIKKAVESDNPRAMTDMGIIYLNGYGTNKDYGAALSWLEKASAGGDTKAPRYIGLIYENGWGKDVSYEEAARNYKLAADRGDITSQYYLGHLYEEGLGVDQDYQKAYQLYQKSAARGDKISLPAIMALGNMYEQGLGVTKDINKALDWYSKGSALGDADAKIKIGHYNYPENPSVMNVTAIVKVLGDGQKIAAVALEYTAPISAASLNPDDYRVPARKIVSVSVNSEAALSSSPQTPQHGNFVIVELDTKIDKNSSPMGGGPEHGGGPDGNNGQNGPPPSGFGGPQMGKVSDKSAEPVILTAKITQTGEISNEEGQVIAPVQTEMESNSTLSPDTQDFKQLVFHDEEFNRDLMYNLFIPENYDPAKKYPLVLFMHDAGVVSNNPTETLTQGLGAVVWASKDDQARHECFVLAPQYDRVIVGDGSKYTEDLDMTINLLKSLLNQYSIDDARLYNTGQSMGGMTSIAMDIKYPDMFAASLLVACQWNPDLVAPLAKKPLWIVVSQGDSKAKPGMDAITAVLKENGATITSAVWNAEADKEILEGDVKQMLTDNTSVNYTVFAGGNHRYTWQYAYSIKGIRDWLFRQHK